MEYDTAIEAKECFLGKILSYDGVLGWTSVHITERWTFLELGKAIFEELNFLRMEQEIISLQPASHGAGIERFFSSE